MSGLELGDVEQAAAVVMAAALVVLLGYIVARRGGLLSPPQRARQWTRRRDPADAREQLLAVMRAPFEKQRLMSSAEYRVFKIIEEDVAAERRGHRVFAQTSLGEILQSPSRSAFRSINSKRVDVLVVDPYGWPLLAVEFQGDGHYQGDAAARDAVKREALRKAGVPYVEVFPTDSDDQIRSRVRERLGWQADAPADG
jgi:hypothetical protein